MNPPQDLSSILNRLCEVGRPTLARTDRGWFCWVTLNVTVLGATFEIKSESSHETGVMAAHQCEERLLTALRQMSRSTDRLMGVQGELTTT